METRGSPSETVRHLEPRIARGLAQEPPTKESVVGMAEILESAIGELEAHTHAESDVYELMLVARFLRDLVAHIDALMVRADVPSGPGLDRVRLASKRLHELAGHVDCWFNEGRRKLLRRGIRPARWESLERAEGVISVGGNAVEDCRALDENG